MEFGPAARTAPGRWRRPACVLPGLLAVTLLLGACGQKGPLYLPGHSKDTPWPLRQDSPKPAAGANAPAGGSTNAKDSGNPAGSGSDGTQGATSAGSASPSAASASPSAGSQAQP